MVEKVLIKDNEKSPISYISKLKNFKNGKEYIFKPGVNIIVGENGSGKTTLLNLIKKYLLVDQEECSCGMFNSNLHSLIGFDNCFLDGVDVYADYCKNTFRLCHTQEQTNDDILKDFRNFSEFYDKAHSSTGENVLLSLNSLFSYIFGSKVNLYFDYFQDKIKNFNSEYIRYINNHSINKDKVNDEWTLLLDEPDRNLSLKNIEYLKNILSFHKEKTQIITTIHNPLLIYILSSNKEINFIEMTRGYINKIKKIIKSY